MGKGDRRTKRGKIWRGSFGKSRPKPSKTNKNTGAEATSDNSAPAETTETGEASE